MFKKTLLGAVVATASLMGALPMAAHAQAATIITVAPPPPVVETMPAPRRGYVWAPGHHEWRGNQYVWVQGQWMRERPGQQYREARWVERNGRWQLVGGDWVRRGPNGDRDGDGIANRYDADSRHNQRAMRPNGDRDGDGVVNRYDRFPNNPNRS